MDIEDQNQPRNDNQDEILPAKKKNRTLQFYKFLLNAMKLEISMNEFMKLVKYSNQGEIAIWILSIILYYSGNLDFPLVWLHLIHVVRGILGMVISYKLPRSYELVDSMIIDDKANFNDIVRESVKQTILPRLKALKGLLLTYFSLTFVNFMVDIVDFLYIISNFNTEKQQKQMCAIVFLILVCLYLG